MNQYINTVVTDGPLTLSQQDGRSEDLMLRFGHLARFQFHNSPILGLKMLDMPFCDISDPLIWSRFLETTNLVKCLRMTKQILETDFFILFKFPASKLSPKVTSVIFSDFEVQFWICSPAASISREVIEPERYGELEIIAGAQIQIMPWTIHRHRALWNRPNAFMPSRFHPQNR